MFISLLLAVIGLLVGALTTTIIFRKSPIQPIDISPLQVYIEKLPDRILNTIVGSTNSHKGALGELLSFLKLSSAYDRIIPFKDIVDFIGITFPTEGNEGSIDFIEIKTGDGARLSKDQKILRQLIQDKKIRFITFKTKVLGIDNQSE